jgi:hypothetical protein
MFIAGTCTIVGMEGCKSFFFKTDRIPGTVGFCIGVLLVLKKWVIFGVIMEMCSVFGLYGGAIFLVANKLIGNARLVCAAANSVPVLGPLLNSAVVDKMFTALESIGTSKRPDL